MGFAVFNVQRFLEWLSSGLILFHKITFNWKAQCTCRPSPSLEMPEPFSQWHGDSTLTRITKVKISLWMRIPPLFGVSFSHKLTCFYCGCSRLSNQMKGSFYLVNCPSASVSTEGPPGQTCVHPWPPHPSPPPHSYISKRVFQSLGNGTTKSFPCCSESTRGDFLTMSPEDGGCQTAFQTRQLLLTKRFKDSITYFPPNFHRHNLFMYELCLSSFRRGKCW